MVEYVTGSTHDVKWVWIRQEDYSYNKVVKRLSTCTGWNLDRSRGCAGVAGGIKVQGNDAKATQ